MATTRKKTSGKTSKTSSKSKAPARSRNSGRKSSGSSKMPGLFQLLKEDHKKVKRLFSQIEKSDGQEREDIYSQIQHELEVHMEGEERFYYPAVREEVEEENRETVLEAFEEHHAAKNVMSEINELTPEDEWWSAKVKVLKDMIEHHIEEEEGELFEVSRKSLSDEQFQQIEEEFRQLKNEDK